MLEVRVRNFQSIRDGKFVIDGFTVVTGTNNLGKSSAFRAVKGVFTNPAATFTRHGQKLTTVEISDEGRYVKWEKGPKKSAVYTLKVGDDTQVFENVGQKCPDQVLEAFGIGTLQAGNTVLWPQFADQFTGPVFLLDKPGSAVADAVANVDRIRTLNRALKTCESDKRSTVSDLKLRQKDQDAFERRLARFEGLDAVTADIKTLEATRVKAERLGTGYRKLVVLKCQYETAKVLMDALEGFERVAALVPPQAKVDGLRRLQIGRKAVGQLRDRLRPLQKQVKALEGFQPVSPEAEELEEVADVLVETRRLRDSLVRSRSHLEALDGFEDLSASMPSQAKVDGLRRLQTGRKGVRQLRERLAPLQEVAERCREGADIAQGLKPDTTLETKAKQVKQVVQLLRAFKAEMATSRQQVADCEQELAETLTELDALVAEMGSALENYADCPLCGIAIEHEHAEIA